MWRNKNASLKKFNFFFQILFGSLTANLGCHYWGGSLTHPMLITASFYVCPKVHWEPPNEVGSLTPAEHLVGFDPGTFRFWLQCLNPLGHSPLNRCPSFTFIMFFINVSVNWKVTDKILTESFCPPFYVSEVFRRFILFRWSTKKRYKMFSYKLLLSEGNEMKTGFGWYIEPSRGVPEFNKRVNIQWDSWMSLYQSHEKYSSWPLKKQSEQ